MKIKDSTIEVMHNAICDVINHYGWEELALICLDKSASQTMWVIWHIAENSLMYDDNHPFFLNGQWERVCPYQNFNLYKIDPTINDNHIETALLQIGRKIGIIVKR